MPLLLSIVISILSFGAVANNDSINNAGAINRAISACAQQGGGTVRVPAGTYVTGSIYMQSRVTLRLERGAILRGSVRLADYAPLQTDIDLSRYESGQGTVNYNSATDPQWSRALIFGVGIHHAGIEGPGHIDGADVRNPLGEEHMRGPHTILLAGCSDIRFKDFSITRSANYAILAYQIDHTQFNALNITGGWDGIHVRGARHTSISRCTLHTGDDALAGGYWTDTRIDRCLINSSCNGIRMIMPSERVYITHCRFEGPGTHPHHTSGRTATETGIYLQPGAWGKAPGRMDHIYIDRCQMYNVLTPITVTLGDDNTAGTISINRLTGRKIGHMALSVKSWGTAPTDQVIISNSDIEYIGKDDRSLPEWFHGKSFDQWPFFPSWGMYFRNVHTVKLHRVKLRLIGKDYRPATLYDHVDRVQGHATLATD